MKKPGKEPKIIYPEMLDYPWVKELEELTRNSKTERGSGGLLSELPKVPINLMLAVMKEAASRPEVMEAYGSVPLNGQIPPRESHLLLWYHEYLKYMYGTTPNPVSHLTIPMRKLANGHYDGLSDPDLTTDLLNRPFICSDDGKNYD